MTDNEVDQYFREIESMPAPKPAVTVPSDEMRDAVLAYPDQRLRPERMAKMLADQGVDALVEQVRGALAGL